MKANFFKKHTRGLALLTIPIQSIRMSDIFESNKYYELVDNQITALETDIFSNKHSFKNVDSLYLSNNLLSSIDSNVFINFINLTFLDLCNNFITTINSNAFNGLVNLET